MFWREFSAFLANLSGMWWSHGVAAGEQMKLQLWPLRTGWVWELPRVLGFGGSNVERTEAAPGHRTFPLCTPGPAFTARVRRNLLHFNPIPKFHTKTAPSYTTGTNWIFFKVFRREAKAWAAWKQNCPMNSPELPHGCSTARNSCGSRKTQISHSEASAVLNFHQHSNSPTLKEN